MTTLPAQVLSFKELFPPIEKLAHW